MQILVILLHSLPIHFSVNSQGRVTVQIKWWPKFLCYFLSVAGGVKNFPSICMHVYSVRVCVCTMSVCPVAVWLKPMYSAACVECARMAASTTACFISRVAPRLFSELGRNVVTLDSGLFNVFISLYKLISKREPLPHQVCLPAPALFLP